MRGFSYAYAWVRAVVLTYWTDSSKVTGRRSGPSIQGGYLPRAATRIEPEW
jgi:hypothetical protein